MAKQRKEQPEFSNTPEASTIIGNGEPIVMIGYTSTKHLHISQAATLVQSYWRGFQAHLLYRSLIYFIFCLQDKFRQRGTMREG
jgi:hypothetical protein